MKNPTLPYSFINLMLKREGVDFEALEISVGEIGLESKAGIFVNKNTIAQVV